MFFKILFITLFGIKIISRVLLDKMNYNYLKEKRGNVPEELKNVVNKAKLEKIDNYNSVKTLFGIFNFLYETAIVMLFLFTPIFIYYVNWVDSFKFIYALRGLLFFLIPLIAGMVLSLPFDYYFHFKIEKSFDFNKYTIGGWLIDKTKLAFLTIVISSIVLVPLFLFVGNSFIFSWRFILISWLSVSTLIFIFTYLAPVIFIPLFYKLKHLENNDLRTKVENLVKKSGFKVRGIFIANESRKSTHGNAMFTGIGNSKKVILFDTLLNNHSDDEILAIVGHEIGHGVKKHGLIFYIFIIFILFIFILAVSILLSSRFVYNSMGIDRIFYAGVFIIYYLFFDVLMYFIEPLMNKFSRKCEYQADAYSKKIMGIGVPLISSFEKFITDDLSVINPHPLYESLHYNHPSLIKRIRALM